jgi:hypothetical protein
LYIPKQEFEANGRKCNGKKNKDKKTDPLEMWQHETHKKGDTGAQNRLKNREK